MRFVTKDSGKRHQWATGAKRDDSSGKGMYDLLFLFAIPRLAELLERGAVKYGKWNWSKGQPYSRYLSSAMRHLFQHMLGWSDEDHLAAAIWNLCALLDTQEMVRLGILPSYLDDTPHFVKELMKRGLVPQGIGQDRRQRRVRGVRRANQPHRRGQGRPRVRPSVPGRTVGRRPRTRRA